MRAALMMEEAHDNRLRHMSGDSAVGTSTIVVSRRECASASAPSRRRQRDIERGNRLSSINERNGLESAQPNLDIGRRRSTRAYAD